MRYELSNQTEQQIQTALELANLESAHLLWQEDDWITYRNTRDLLVALLRSPRAALVGIDQLRFIYFVNNHLWHGFHGFEPDWKIFRTSQVAIAKRDVGLHRSHASERVVRKSP